MYYAPVHQIDNNNRPIFLYTNGSNQEWVCVLCVNYYTEINHGLKMRFKNKMARSNEIFMIYVKVSSGYMEGPHFSCLLAPVECHFCMLGRANIPLFLSIWPANKTFTTGHTALALNVLLSMFSFDEVIKKEFTI